MQGQSHQDENLYFKLAEILCDNELSGDRRITALLTYTPRNKNSVLFNSDIQPEKLQALWYKALRKFNKLNQQYKYFLGSDLTALQEEYARCYVVCYYIAHIVESTGDKSAKHEALNAYKMMVWFRDEPNTALKNFGAFVAEHAQYIGDPVYELLTSSSIPTLPELSEVPENIWTKFICEDLVTWRRLIQREGVFILHYFAKGLEWRIKNPDAPLPIDKEELELKILSLNYERAQENIKMARICARNSIQEESFNEALDKDIRLKTTDTLPNVVYRLPAYNWDTYFLKLPAGDIRGLFSGEILGNDISMNRVKQKYAIAAATLQHHALYVLVILKPHVQLEHLNWEDFESQGEFLGMSYVWRSREGNIVFDSIENKNHGYDRNMYGVLLKCGELMLKADPTIHRISCGTGSGTPTKIAKQALASSITQYEIMAEHHSLCYPQSAIEIIVSSQLGAARKEIYKPLRKYVFSPRQAAIMLQIQKHFQGKVSIFSHFDGIITALQICPPEQIPQFMTSVSNIVVDPMLIELIVKKHVKGVIDAVECIKVIKDLRIIEQYLCTKICRWQDFIKIDPHLLEFLITNRYKYNIDIPDHLSSGIYTPQELYQLSFSKAQRENPQSFKCLKFILQSKAAVQLYRHSVTTVSILKNIAYDKGLEQLYITVARMLLQEQDKLFGHTASTFFEYNETLQSTAHILTSYDALTCFKRKYFTPRELLYVASTFESQAATAMEIIIDPRAHHKYRGPLNDHHLDIMTLVGSSIEDLKMSLYSPEERYYSCRSM